MNQEIERKFLVKGTDWKKNATIKMGMQQGYLPKTSMTVRVRTIGKQAFLTLKGPALSENVRQEFEYPIPLEDAQLILQNYCKKPQICKTRWIVPAGHGLKWEIDEFEDINAGLILAEIELSSMQENFERPDWLGREVTGITRYYNSNLTEHPFQDWTEAEKAGC